jgi:alkylhydroperoxidase family enzyme
VPDAIWDDAADHFDEKGLAAIILMIALTNFFNRINVTIREPAGTTWS